MTTPRTIMIVGIALLLWSVMGIAAFILQYGIDPAELTKSDPAAARAFGTMPGWLWVVHAVAVGAGLAGALALLMRRKIAAPLFIVSLVAVLVQFGYTLGATNLIAEKGVVAAAGFPAFIIVMATFEVWYSRLLMRRNVLR